MEGSTMHISNSSRKIRGAVTRERTLLEEEVDIWGFMQRDNESMNVQHKIWVQPGYAV